MIFAPQLCNAVGVVDLPGGRSEVVDRAVRVGGKGAAFGESVLEPGFAFSFCHSRGNAVKDCPQHLSYLAGTN